jgi:hypothetical protein
MRQQETRAPSTSRDAGIAGLRMCRSDPGSAGRVASRDDDAMGERGVPNWLRMSADEGGPAAAVSLTAARVGE